MYPIRPDGKKKLLIQSIQRRIARGITGAYTATRSSLMANSEVRDTLKQYVETLSKLVKKGLSGGRGVSISSAGKTIKDETQAQDLLQDCRFLQRTDGNACPSAHLLLAFSLELVRSSKLRDGVEIHLQRCEKCALYIMDLESPIQHPVTKEILNALKSKKTRVIDVIEKHLGKP